MKNILRSIVASLLISISISFVAVAAAKTENMSFSFELTVDGKETKELETGDIITVVLKLHRKDAEEAYIMYAMQDEIRYDGTFLELVEGSAVLSSGISSTDIGMVDKYREFYMNYLSMSGGAEWDADMLIGSVQFRVIGKSGVTKLTSQDYLVSLPDGSASYPCEANEVTLILSTDCTVSFETNGGSEIPSQTVQYGEKIIRPQDPVREGYTFGGWYTDIHMTDEWNFEDNRVDGNLSLYAKWEAQDITGEKSDAENCNYLWLILMIILLLILLFLLRLWYSQRKKSMV